MHQNLDEKLGHLDKCFNYYLSLSECVFRLDVVYIFLTSTLMNWFSYTQPGEVTRTGYFMNVKAIKNHFDACN